MNCRQFQNKLYEYVEGSLDAGAQAAVEKHLEACAACRQRVQQERDVARSLAEGFKRASEGLELPAEVGRRVLAAVAEERAAREERESTVCFWRRLAWPTALTASAAALLAGWFLFVPGAGHGPGRSQPRVAEGVVSVQLSYVVPIYTFRQEGGLVIDALTYQTNIVNERLQTELASLH